jgi:RNA polymerase sigma-70 factor (ECF subfamily)
MSVGRTEQHELYDAAAREYGCALDRLAAGYEADPDKRRDLRQEIHFQLWRSLAAFDGRCALKTWTFRVAHNTAASYVMREQRRNTGLVALEEVAVLAEPDIDRARALAQLSALIRQLKPLDRQIILCYLEAMDAASIAGITGLAPANVSMKVHRIKTILARRFREEERNHA